MLPKGSLLIASAAGALLLWLSIELGGAMSAAAIVVCAFALMIGAPIAILIWFGSLTERDAQRKALRVREKRAASDALLWQTTLKELQIENALPAPREAAPLTPASCPVRYAPASPRVPTYVAAAQTHTGEGIRATRPILALYFVLASSLGLGGCGVPPEAWAMIQPGMGTADLVAVAGGPDYIRSNGTAEVWQYCRDLTLRDESRFARYYTAILVERQKIKEVVPYPVLSNAGCEDFYRAEF